MKKILIALLPGLLVLAGCTGKTITASEPAFSQVSTQKATGEDVALADTLAGLDPAPADRIALAESIGGLDASTLPAIPSQPLRTYQVGDTRTFWTHNSDTFESTRITAQLMAISKHAYFWQDQASQALNASGQIATQDDWDSAGESFDRSYELVRAVFGQEESPGLDGDARLFIVNSDSLGRVGGYFGQGDLLPAVIEPYSNEGQYFYISNTWSGGIAGDYYKEVLAHEFQHMIQKQVDPNEEGWLNEGFSMLAQQVAGMRGDNSVADYLVRPDQSLWYWSSQPLDYGQSYLYVDYLYEQMGQDFIKSLSADPRNGLAGIDEALAEVNSARDADELYMDAMLAAFFNDPALADGQYAYQNADVTGMTTRYDFTSLPAVYQGTVQQYGGVDVVTAVVDGKARLTFHGDQRVQLVPAEAHSGANFWWSNRYDSTFATLTRAVDLTGLSSATLKYWAWYDIEEDWDYAYVLVSTDNGTHWDLLTSTSSRETNPNSQNLGYGISGLSGGGEDPVWVQESVDLSAYAGKPILLRFAMQNDLVVNHYGLAVDDLSIPEAGWSDDAESGAGDWITDGFVLSHDYVPQTWGVRVVEQKSDGSITVHGMDIQGGLGRLDLPADGTQRLVVFVFGLTRDTTVPASYRLEIKP